MWSTVSEIYPVHMSPILAPLGQALVKEPQVSMSHSYAHDYIPVQPPRTPYSIIGDGYTRNLWIC